MRALQRVDTIEKVHRIDGMRLVFSCILAVAVLCSSVMFNAKAQSAHEKMETGLLEEIYKPFSEDGAFPLETLIAFDPAAVLETYRGRCLSLDIFGADRRAGCEPRMAVSYRSNDTSIHWFTRGREAFGLESETIVEPPHDRVWQLQLKKIHVFRDGRVSSEAATGECRIDAFSSECHATGQSGRMDVNFATLGGPSTRQFPVEENVFRIPKAEVFVARGQCVSLHDPGGDLTPYCAGFAGQAILDKTSIMTFFTADDRTVFGFSGSIAYKIEGADGHSFTIPVTDMLRIKGGKSGDGPNLRTVPRVGRGGAQEGHV